MSDVVVRPVESRRERREFIELPWTLYRDDPLWIPPLRLVAEELAGYRRHPFYEFAQTQTFLARRGGRVCGRIAATINPRHDEVYNEKRGFFGFFESENDEAISRALFDAARDWLAARGIHQMRGPTNPSVNYECGLLVEGFDESPTFMMAYNPPYYAQLFEAYGWRKAQDLYAYTGHRELLPRFQTKLQPVADKILEWCRATIRPMHHKRDLQVFLDLYNTSFAQNWGAVPLSKAEMGEHFRTLHRLLDRQMAVIAEVDGKGVGAVIALPDLNPTIREIDGRLLPFGFLKLLRHRHSVRRVRIISINIVPEYQRWGLGIALLGALVPKALQMGVEEAEFSWIAESNQLACESLDKAGVPRPRTFRIYDYGSPVEQSQVRVDAQDAGASPTGRNERRMATR